MNATPIVALPISAVTLLEDRAELDRRVRLDLAAGTHRLRLGPVTPLAVDQSLRAEFTPDDASSPPPSASPPASATGATGAVPPASAPQASVPGAVDGATVVDARLVRLWTPPPPGAPGPEASKLRYRVHELGLGVRDTEAAERRAVSRLAVLEQLLGELRRDISETVGAGLHEPERWSAELDRAYAAHTGQAEELRRIGRQLAELRAELSAAQAALAAAEEQPPVLTAYVDVVVQVPAALTDVVLRLRHLVPCALWRPAYRAVLAAGGGSLDLESEAVIWQRTGEDWPEVRLALSTARSALAAEPPTFTEDLLELVDRTPEERRVTEVDLREVESQSLGPDREPGAAQALPGVDDGGEVRLLSVPEPVRVRGDGRPHRVRLASASLPARTEYLATPELSSLVTLVARFRNDTGLALLSGPVELVRGSGFVGRGELRFTAPGAEAELSFGSEDTFRVTRSVRESRDTAGLSGRTLISRTVLVNLSRFARPGAEPVTVGVRERIPVSEIASVEVRLAKEGCDPAPEAVDADGIVHYRLRLGPDERRVLTLAYEISAARAVAL